MKDITDKRLLYAKGFLFLLGGGLASALILWECPSLRMGLLLAIAVWCFARAYYFAFYVIEHYVDPGYRFSGLWSFALYTLGKRSNGIKTEEAASPAQLATEQRSMEPGAGPDQAPLENGRNSMRG